MLEREKVGVQSQASSVNCAILENVSNELNEDDPPAVLLEGHCTSQKSSPLNELLMAGTMSIYEKLQTNAGHSIEFTRVPMLHIFEKEEHLDYAKRELHLPLCASPENVPPGNTGVIVVPPLLNQLEPLLSSKVCGAIMYPNCGTAYPAKTMLALSGEAEKAGAQIISSTEVMSLQTTGEGWEVEGRSLDHRLANPDLGLRSVIRCKQVVLACGSMTTNILGLLPSLGKKGAGFSVEDQDETPWVISVVGQMFRTAIIPNISPEQRFKSIIVGFESWLYWKTHSPTHPPRVTHEYMHEDRHTRHVYIKMTPEGRIIAGGDRRVHPTQLPRLAHPLPRTLDNMHDSCYEHAVSVLPIVGEVEVEHKWGGVMPFSRDDEPIIGEIGGHPGMFIISGLSGSGFMRGAMAGAVDRHNSPSCRPAYLHTAFVIHNFCYRLFTEPSPARGGPNAGKRFEDPQKGKPSPV